MRVWITGATGFVGGAMLRRLAARGDEIVALSRPSSAHVVDRRLAAVSLVDLPDVSALQGLARPDSIVHCAADIRLAGPDRERRAHATHVDGTVALAEVAKANGARFVHLSTIDVYAGENGRVPIDETTPTGPRDLYGETKLLGEVRLRETLPNAIVFRAPGIYGPGSRGDHIEDVARKIARRRFFHVGDGRAKRSWLFVENLVDAIAHALEGHVPGGVYVVDDGAPVERRMLAESIARALGRPSRFVHVPVPVALVVARSLERLSARVGVDAPLTERAVRFRSEGLVLDTRRLRATGFSPSWGLDAAIDVTVQWMRAQRHLRSR